MHTNVWAWRQGFNPYRQTVFQVLGLTAEMRSRAAVKARVQQRRNHIRKVPEKFRLFGRQLSEAEVNEAETTIETLEGRLYAELCTHRRRDPGGDGSSSLVEDVEQLTVPAVVPALTIDPARLLPLLPRPARREYEPVASW